MFLGAKRFYFLGLAGSGMSSLARILVRLGYQVWGWDDAPDPHVLELLISEGVTFQHWSSLKEPMDLVVYSTAIAHNHPAWEWVGAEQLQTAHRSDVLAELSKIFKTIAVCGSHGKSTVTSMIHEALKVFAVPHLTILGGLLQGHLGGTLDEKPEYLLIEACESDRTFLKYHAHYVVITNLSPDHLEYYDHRIESLIDAFHGWLEDRRPKLLMGLGDNLDALAKRLSIPYARLGLEYQHQHHMQGLSSQVLLTHDHFEQSFFLPAPGAFNAINAALALAMVDKMGFPIWNHPSIFANYTRVGRRFEYQMCTHRVSGETIHWVSDYGHHPVELYAMLTTLRELWPNQPIRMVFEPHRYSRTQAQFDEFVQVLSLVDELILLPIYAASEAPMDGVSSQAILRAMHRSEDQCVASENLLERLKDWSGAGVLVFQGAGSVHYHALAWLKCYA